tara:strand:+ start:1474 stop:1662 length:189 start_codon:yes stop_codon:yes gene_type:complete
MLIIEELRAIIKKIFKGEITMEDKINNEEIHDEIIEDIVEEVVEKENNNNSGDAPRGRCRRD